MHPSPDILGAVERRTISTGVGWIGRWAALAIVVAVPLTAATAEASPYIQAHRGGSLETKKGKQRPVVPESSMAGFKAAAKRGFVLELDVKLSADRRAMVIHDGTLDRTTDCEGRVDSKTLAQLRSDCDLDTIGSGPLERPLDAKDDRRAEIPALTQVLALAKRRGVTVNIEVKNIPTDPDFDASERLREHGRRRDQDERPAAEQVDRAELLPAQPRTCSETTPTSSAPKRRS